MKRKDFIGIMSASGGLLAGLPLLSMTNYPNSSQTVKQIRGKQREYYADLVVCGGGLGGVAAALAALRGGLRVILTEETDWIGGQITQQGVPPDEHQWIETHGATQMYRDFRNLVRQYYKRNYPLTNDAMQNPLLNPGDGSVSRLCHEPRVALAVLYEMLAPHLSTGKLQIFLNYRITAADVNNDKVLAVMAENSFGDADLTLSAPYFIDATELGDLLPLTGTEFVTGTESRTETRELHAPDTAKPDNHQAFTVCFAMDYVPGEDHTIEKPRDYDFWKNHVPDLTPPWPGKLLDLTYTHPSSLKPRQLGFSPDGTEDPAKFNLWNYRRIINKNNFLPETYPGDITIVNWPQNDYMSGNLFGESETDFEKHFDGGKQLSLSLLYWLQTEVPRYDKGYGWPGLRLRPDIMGTIDGMAKYPYVRESRRIKAVFTVLEKHVGKENRALITGKEENKAQDFYDSVGIGYYHIDLHPSSGGDNYIDFASLPFQIPLGALIPQRITNLIPANKNIGTTHITNGCYRLHPVEWNIGESAGNLIVFALSKNISPAGVRENPNLLNDFQTMI
ncbi:MAG: FAD-dependent oxidoreductase, partial [Bacteroidetes bacterium]